MTYRSLRQAVFKTLDPASRQTLVEKVGNIAISALILSNVLAVVLESMPNLESRFALSFERFEAFSVTFFTVEYLARLWTCIEMKRYHGSVGGRLRFALRPMALLDLAVVLPWYVPGVNADLRFVRIVRLVRMLRVLKFARYSQTLRTFAAVFRAKRPDLAVVLLFLMVLIVIASSSMYLVEHEAQPKQFSSIPAAMWWSVATLTTVGYGDIYPITPVGKFLGSLIALIGIGFFALPAGVLASAFAEEVARHARRDELKRCPHCGEALE